METPVYPAHNYLSNGHGLKSWLLTKDHKRIAILYLISISIFFFLGGLFAVGIRLELTTPQGDLFQPDTYNKFFTLHGAVMVFLVIIPGLPAALGNMILPIQLGAPDVAFPKLNLTSFYLWCIGTILLLTSVVMGGVDTGWTFYTPYSTSSGTAVITATAGAFIAGFSSILTGLNFIVTVHKMRAPGLTWFRLPLFVWAQYATSIINVLGTPVVAITLLLVVMERAFGFGIFDPARGGDPVLFQHMFWFYSHPAVYIMILPGFGVISEVIACFARRRVVGYEFVALSSLAIAAIGFFVWGHHMFVASQSPYAGMVFSILTMLIAIPTAIKVFNWTATMYRGSVSLTAPMIYAIGFIGLFLVGGLTGLYLATMATDIHLHDTYFVVAHFHYVMVGGMVMAWLSGIHFWWPKMFGKMYNETAAKIAAVLIFFGFNFTFFPQFIVGYLGMPRRYHVYPEEFQIFHVMSTLGASIMAAGYLLALAYFLHSIIAGKTAPRNPWGATGLEWNEADSPPNEHNFAHPPVVDREAYDYTDERIYSDLKAEKTHV